MKPIMAMLEKRASIYSDRPRFTVVGELMELEKVRTIITIHVHARNSRNCHRAHLSTSMAMIGEFTASFSIARSARLQ